MTEAFVDTFISVRTTPYHITVILKLHVTCLAHRLSINLDLVLSHTAPLIHHFQDCWAMYRRHPWIGEGVTVIPVEELFEDSPLLPPGP